MLLQRNKAQIDVLLWGLEEVAVHPRLGGGVLLEVQVGLGGV